MIAGKMMTVAVFGSSEPVEGDALYETAYETGWLLASRGFNVCTGGYGGVMEAASKGARKGGSDAIGVTVNMFSWRNPNKFVSIHYNEDDLYMRTKRLIEVSDGFIILPGKSGTLSELTFLWALHRGGVLGKKPIILLGEIWKHFMKNLTEADLIEEQELEATKIVLTPQEAVDEIAKCL
ncbi:MAG: LOG family protein [Acidobacteriota bacterium]